MSFEKPSKEVMEMYSQFNELIEKLTPKRMNDIADLVKKNMQNDILFEQLRSLRLDNMIKERKLIILCEEDDEEDCCCDNSECCPDCGYTMDDCYCEEDDDDCTRSYFRNKERFNELLRKAGCHFDEDEDDDEDDHCCPGCGYHPSNCHCDLPKAKHPQCNCGGNCK